MNMVTPGSRRQIAFGISFSMAVMLSACGGGGGGSSPPPAPVPVSVTCPNGTTQTAATTDLANAACPLPQLVSVSPTNANAAVSVDAFVSVDVVTDSTLDATSITATNVTLKAGTTAVAGAASAVGTKSLKFAPTAKLNYAQAYSFSATVKDTLGKVLTVNSTFTTAAVACVAPKVPAADGQSCVTPVAWWPPTFVPMGVKLYLDSTKAPTGAVVNATYPGQTQSGLLPAACVTTGDACWQEAVRNGTLKFVSTAAVDAGQPTRSVVFGSYKTVSTIAFPGTVLYCNKPFFADDGTRGNPNESVENYCVTSETVYSMGNALGEIFEEINPTTGVSTYYQKKFDQNLSGWVNIIIPSP